MARSGLYKTDVKKARDALLALGRHPSLDAIRIELGNTGSKTTIHKYLKELEDEEGGVANGCMTVSEAVLDLVERLAMQLENESRAKIDECQVQAAERERYHADTAAEFRAQIDSLTAQLDQVRNAYNALADSQEQRRTQLQSESIARHTAEQQVADLKERLLENEGHRRSLEEKHQHAREALEHYRHSVKEQRDQDSRRHEQQIQQLQAEMRHLQQSLVVKQEEVTRLNQEGSRLVNEISHAELALRERDTRLHQTEQKIDVLRPFQERCNLLEKDLAQKEKMLVERDTQYARSVVDLQQSQLQLAAATAQIDSQENRIAELRGLLDKFQPQSLGEG
ncbi:integrase [Oxalicibacterium solurbis]|uniref:Integrase n=2 Tax=Oxalicibacterium solurbis TaxID=69280 RepID=A0A8J3F5L3_9BURK|nr:integrase [Oxalicibacterium solurbis]